MIESGGRRSAGGREGAGLYATVLDGGEDTFAALKKEWKELYAHCPRATVFQSWEWNDAWWGSFGRGNRLRLVAVRERGGAGRFVGLAPLMIAGGGNLPGPLLFAGTGLTDHLDVLVRGGACRLEVAAEIRRALFRGPLAGEWLYADLRDLSPGAEARQLFGDWDGRSTRLEGQEVPIIAAEPPEQKIKGVDKRWRQKARNTMNRINKDGAGFHEAAPGEGARGLIRLHRGLWEGRGINGVHLTEAFEEFVVRAVGSLSASGLGGIRELRGPDGSVLASHLYLAGHASVAGYLYGGGDGPRAKRYSLNVAYIWDLLEIACAMDRAEVSGLRGAEDYKLRWKPARIERNERFVLENPTLGPGGVVGRGAYAVASAGARARAACARAARDETAPRPVLLMLDAAKSLARWAGGRSWSPGFSSKVRASQPSPDERLGESLLCHGAGRTRP